MVGQDGLIERTRLAAFSRLLLGLAAAFALGELTLAFAVGSPRLFGTSLAMVGVAIAVQVARAWISRGRAQAAVQLIGFALLAATLCCVPLAPFAIASLATVPLAVFALTLPWLAGTRLRRLALVCVATEVLVAAAGLLLQHEPAPLWARGLAAVSLVAGGLLVVLLLVQHGERQAQSIAAVNESHRLLRESEELHRRMVEAASEGLWRADAAGRTSFVNSRMAALLGRTRDELLTESIFEHLDEASRLTARALVRDHEAGAGRREELTLRRKDGSALSVSVGAVPVQDEAGRYAGFLWLVTDTTELAALQARLTGAEHMASIGNLAAGVAHDFNNNLTLIIGRAESLAQILPKEAKTQGAVTQIITASKRAAELTSQLLALARQQVLRPEVLSLNELTENLHELLRSLLGERIALRLVLEPTLRDVHVDPAQLERVIVNLAMNARDAMPDGGDLVIRTASIAAGTQVRGLSPGRYSALSMSDTGCGMDEATRARLFEPFFTTKPVGDGTGLGLSTAYGIVKQSGGHLVVESEPGRGSRFTLYLPETESSRSDPVPAAQPVTDAEATETLLLVEDNADLRQLLGSELTATGYRVLEATNGQQALSVCEAHSGPIHLVVTDVVMRGIGGVELTKRLRTQRPALPILYMSGHPERSFAALAELVTPQNFIQKPFSIDALLGKVRANLAGEPRPPMEHRDASR